MSKWSSARFSAVVRAGAIGVALMAFAGLAACNRNQQESDDSNVRASTVVAPEMRVDAVAQEEPAVARTQWRAANEAARDIAGNLRISIQSVRGGPVVLAFANGVTITAQSVNVVPSDTRSGVGAQSFAALLGGDPRVDTHVYRIVEENVSRSAAQGGLCGENATRHLAISEYVDSAGRWVFKVASFRGDRPPGTSGEDPGLCRAYAYVAPA